MAMISETSTSSQPKHAPEKSVAQRQFTLPPWPWSSPGVSASQLRRDQALLEKCGFRDVRLATRKVKRRLVCLVATE